VRSFGGVRGSLCNPCPEDILFLCGIFKKEEQAQLLLKSKGNVQFAANVHQWSIINGLEENLSHPITLLNSLFVGSYPLFHRDLLIKSRKWSHREGVQDKYVGFVNIKGIKSIWKAISLAREASKWAGDGTSAKKLLIYSMYSPFLFAAARAKRVNPEIQICLIVTDLPEFMSLGETNSRLFLIGKRIDRCFMDRYLKAVNTFVLLTRHMTDKLPIGKRPFVVIEGIANEEDAKATAQEAQAGVVLYTGTLTKAYGIITLVNAFRMTRNERYRLIICGAGEAEEDISNAMKEDGRISFLGLIPRDEALQLQRKATALINPRNSEGEYTKYSFPSKIMEYLLSGRPLIAYKLPGIPDEYDKYIYYIDGNSPGDMAKVIDRVLSKNERELNAFGADARAFVLKNKNQMVQTKKILDLLGEQG